MSVIKWICWSVRLVHGIMYHGYHHGDCLMGLQRFQSFARTLKVIDSDTHVKTDKTDENDTVVVEKKMLPVSKRRKIRADRSSSVKSTKDQLNKKKKVSRVCIGIEKSWLY